MAIHTFNLTDTRTATPVTLDGFSYDDATKILTIDCANSLNIPATPPNGEAVVIGLLKDMEIAAKNKLYNPDYPISEPQGFNNPDFTQETNFQYQTRTNNEDTTLATRKETQTVYAPKFLLWFKSTAPTAANAVNDND